MKKITYLFGAGASANSLPVVSQISPRINGIIEIFRQSTDFLKLTEPYDFFGKKVSETELFDQLLIELDWLSNESGKHANIDTFAKKLYLRGETSKLKKLKVSLLIYFICEQLINKPGPRYDYFFAALLKQSLTDFPVQVRIVSWNYDYQFELSYSEYSGLNSLEDNQEKPGVYNKYGKRNFGTDRFSIAKLNGTTQLTSSGGHKPTTIF